MGKLALAKLEQDNRQKALDHLRIARYNAESAVHRMADMSIKAAIALDDAINKLMEAEGFQKQHLAEAASAAGADCLTRNMFEKNEDAA